MNMTTLCRALACLLLISCGARTEADGQIYALAVTPDSGVIVTEGDSLTWGKDSWTRQTDRRIVNVAKGGDTLGYMLAQSTEVDAQFQPGAIATLWAGTNDVANWSTPAAVLLEKTAAWVQGRQAVGFRVAVFTMLPRASFMPEHAHAQQTFSDALVAAPPAGAVVIEARGVPGSPRDGVLWALDGIHLTRDGQRWLLDNRIEPALRALAKN
jgi:hypothetical protein